MIKWFGRMFLDKDSDEDEIKVGDNALDKVVDVIQANRYTLEHVVGDKWSVHDNQTSRNVVRCTGTKANCRKWISGVH